MSSDAGLTWSIPIQVNQTPNSVPAIDRQAFSPTIAVAADGTVGVSYYDFRNNTAAPGATTDYWLAYAPAGTTSSNAWGEMRLTTTSFNLEQAPTRFGGDTWLGDYEGLAAAGNDFVAAWAMPDGSAVAQESVFFRRAISMGGSSLSAAAAPAKSNTMVNTLTMPQVQPHFAKAIPSSTGAEFVKMIGNTIYFNRNSDGWGRLENHTMSSNSDVQLGNPGKQQQSGLLAVLDKEIEVLGHKRKNNSLKVETLIAEHRHTSTFAVDAAFLTQFLTSRRQEYFAMN